METIKPYLDELVEFLKNASPIVWETGRRQVYVQVAQDAIWFLFFIAFALGGYWLFRYSRQKWEEGSDDYNDWNFGIYGGIGVILLAAVVEVVLLANAISMLINPNYYAIKVLLELVGVGE